MKKLQDIEDKITKLPEYVRPELNDFIEFLLLKYGDEKPQNARFKFDWEGKLKSKYSSVELQHKAMDWR
jgi:hypothetical protein